jgi:hypothetical protein
MESALKLSCALAEGREGSWEAFGSCHGRISEEEGMESRKFPSPMRKAD